MTGLDVGTLSRVTQLNLADSALHAPAAGWGKEELYPVRGQTGGPGGPPRQDQPLPDGNRRAAWVALRAFVELNGWSWATYPSVDEAELAVVAIASGERDEARVASWLRDRSQGPAGPGA